MNMRLKGKHAQKWTREAWGIKYQEKEKNNLA